MLSSDLRKFSKGRLVIDCTNFLGFYIKHRGVSGIQRVILCLLQVLQNDKNVIFAFHDGYDYKELLLCPDAPILRQLEVFAKRRVSFKSPLARRGLAKKIEGFVKLLLRRHARISRTLDPRDGDTFFFPDAGWANPDALSYVRVLKEKLVVRLAVYVYDLIPYYGESFVDFGSFVAFKNYVEGVIELADQIICISDFTRRDLDLFSGGCSASVITLAHEFGLFNLDQFTSKEAKERIIRLGVDDPVHTRPFALCVGTIDRRKNQVSLVRAWIALSHRRVMPLLVLAGRYGSMSDDVRILIEREKYAIKVIENPSDEDIGSLYYACQFTVFPSYYEGWGLPVGESLWFGKPCLASNATAIPEVGGQHCRYFDPSSMDDLIGKLEGMLDNPPDLSNMDRGQLRTWDQVTADLLHAL